MGYTCRWGTRKERTSLPHERSIGNPHIGLAGMLLKLGETVHARTSVTSLQVNRRSKIEQSLAIKHNTQVLQYTKTRYK